MTLSTNGGVVNSSETSERKRKCIKVIAKLGLATGLLSLLTSVTVYGYENRIHLAIDSASAQNQNLFRMKEINEYVYHTNLKYSTLQKLCRDIFS